MKLAQKNLSQKGIAPVAVIIFLAVIVIGLVTLYYSKSAKTSSPNNQITNQKVQSSTEPAQETGLEKTETKDYIFYYPKGYLLSHQKPNQNTVLFYTAVNNSQEYEDAGLGIRLDIEPLLQRNDTPTSEFCKQVAQFSYKGVTMVKAVPVDYVQTHGCEFIYSKNIDSKNVKDVIVQHEKHLWYKEKKDFSVVSSRAIYFNSTPQQEKNNLDLAVESFSLK